MIKISHHLFREHPQSMTLCAATDQNNILAFTSRDREHWAMIFKAPGWISRQFFHCGCALNCKSHSEPMVKLQWFNLCGRTRLQSFSLEPATISGLGSGLKTTASNHKIQTNISIKQDHTVKRKVMIFFGVKHLHLSERDAAPHWKSTWQLTANYQITNISRCQFIFWWVGFSV